MPAARRRPRSRYDGPAYAERFPDTREGMEGLASHEEARRLPRHTDPDTIEDEGTRAAFLHQLQEQADRDESKGRLRVVRNDSDDEDDHEDDDEGEKSARPSRARRADAGGLRASGGLDASVGSAVLGVVAYALLVNYVRGGTPQVRKWLSAKFTNGRGKLS